MIPQKIHILFPARDRFFFIPSISSLNSPFTPYITFLISASLWLVVWIRNLVSSLFSLHILIAILLRSPKFHLSLTGGHDSKISRCWRHCFSLCSVCVSYVLRHQNLFIFVCFLFFSSSYILSVELFAMFTWDLAVLELSWLGSENSFSIQVLRVS